jgi:hypothetical protein
MGVFLCWCGDSSVDPKRLDELNQRVTIVLDQGGMMQLEETNLCDRSIYVLRPLKEAYDPYDGEPYYDFMYNYFEDTIQENAEYYLGSGTLSTEKFGSSTFNIVCSTVQILMEFYSVKPCIANENGDLYRAEDYIEWLNYLFDEKYTNERIQNPWHVFRLVHQDRYSNDIDRLYADTDIKYINKYIDQSGFPIWLFIGNTKEAIELCKDTCRKESENEPEKLSALYFIGVLVEALEQMKVQYEADGHDADENTNSAGDGDEQEKEEPTCAYYPEYQPYIFFGNYYNDEHTPTPERVKKLLIRSKNGEPQPDGLSEAETLFYELAAMIRLPIVVRCITETFGSSFWRLYDAVYIRVPHDPERAAKASAKTKPLPPLPKMSTSDFLGCDDDDRAYWWTPGGDIKLSREFRSWLSGLDRRLKKAARKTPMKPDNFLWYMVDVLDRANENQKHYLLAFGTMFDDYLAHLSDPRRQASIHLLEKMLDQYDKKYPTLEPQESTIFKWTFEGESEEEYEYAEDIRRYLAVLGNLELRKKVFGF